MLCDLCDEREITPDTRIEVRLRRLSDPQDLSCVLWACSSCTPPSLDWSGETVPTAGTAKQWNQWVERFGARHDVLWLT